MKHLKKFNEAKRSHPIMGSLDKDSDEDNNPIKGGDKQDVVHWEVVIEYGKPFLKISTDDDVYYTKLNNSEKHKLKNEEDYD